jgi:hypothetical protein
MQVTRAPSGRKESEIPLPAVTDKDHVSCAEWARLVQCVRATVRRQSPKQQFGEPLRWDVYRDLAEEHGVLGLVAREVLEHNDAGVPRETVEALRSWRRAHALFTLNLTAEMFRLLASLRHSGIDALVIKGPVLSVRCYGDPGLRQYGDLDLIVRDKDILRVTELMLIQGYEGKVSLSAIQAKKAPGEYNFRHKNSGPLIEFHTERTFRYHPRPLPIEQILRRQARVELDGRVVPALSLEDELVLICVHGAKHLWERLGYIADVTALACQANLDWAKVESSAEEVGAQRMLYLGLRLAEEVLDAPLPKHIHERLQSDPAVANLTSQIRRWLPAAGSAPPGIVRRAVFRVRMHGKAVRGLSYLLRLSFSPTEEDWGANGDGNRPWLLDALARPFRLARKYGKGNAE